MATETEVKQRIRTFFEAPAKLGGTSAFSDDDSLPEFARTTQQPFSVFDPSTLQRRTELMRKANAAFQEADSATNGLDAAMGVFEDAARDGQLAMAQHMLGVFAVHAPKLRDNTPAIPVPPMAFRVEGGAVPFDDDDEEDEGGGGVSVPLQGEDLLHIWREDLYLNEHHRHWHFVYDAGGLAEPGRIRMKNRHGEVFVYMHQQMLARYDTERLAVGLNKVEALTDFGASLGDGYDPDAREPKSVGYGARPDNDTITMANQADLERRRHAYRDYLANGGQIAGRTIELNASNVGTALESGLGFGTDVITQQAELDWIISAIGPLNLHNFGHGHIASLGAGTGVMTNPHTSLQDPVFWRWHRMIDDLAQEYYAQLPAYEAEDVGIAVSGDQIVVLSEIAGDDFGSPDRNAVKAALLQKASDQIDANDPGADRLHTGKITERFEYSQPPVTRRFQRASLMTERFAVVARVNADTQGAATARLFLCADEFIDLDGTKPAGHASEHRFWIELDRKPVELQQGQNHILFMADESSVVRKLGGFAPWPTSSFTAGGFDELHNRTGSNDDFCDCGWPLNLLLPTGTQDGMAFQLMVLVSPGNPGMGDGACGSRAFCGARFDAYPELPNVNLGYPFDRPAPNGTIALIDASPNMARRGIAIEHIPNLSANLGLETG
ncbi:MAG: tyrosinase family protein [Pseudomonadota bacterium]